MAGIRCLAFIAVSHAARSVIERFSPA